MEVELEKSLRWRAIIKENFVKPQGWIVLFLGTVSVTNILTHSFGRQTILPIQIIENYELVFHGGVQSLAEMASYHLSDLGADLAILYLLFAAVAYRHEMDLFKWQKFRLLFLSLFWPVYYLKFLFRLIWTSFPAVQNRMIRDDIEEFEQYDISDDVFAEKPGRIIRHNTFIFVDLSLPLVVMMLTALVLT